jgi:S1-C subfamily serine protease
MDAPLASTNASTQQSRDDLRRLRFSRHRPVMALAAMLLGAALGASGGTAAAEPGSAAAEPKSAASSEQALALQRASDAVVGVEVQGVEQAPSNETLGRRRSGSGVVIGDDGVVLTIGYLLLEADEVSLLLDNGRRLPARVLGMDLASGFGLVQALVPIGVSAAPMAKDTGVSSEESLLLVSGGNEGAVSVARLSARRAYSGYWEYHIDNALFTRPPRTDHSGAGLFNARGELLGIGSLLVMDTPGEHEAGPGNMFVPIDLLAPIIGELRERGSSSASHRAWLGLNCDEHPDGVRIVKVNPDSPAEAAGLEPGDLITGIDGAAVDDLEGFYKRLWNGGGPERSVMLDVRRNGEHRTVGVRSVDRMRTLRQARTI